MKIPVVFNDGKEQEVPDKMLQMLIDANQIMFFKRSAGWAVIGRDQIRSKSEPFPGKDRRQ